MPTTKTRAGGRVRTLTLDEFMAKHESELLEPDHDSVADESIPLAQLMKGESRRFKLPVPVLMAELKRWWLARLLRAAAKENSPEAYSSLLRFWLHKLDLDPPVGVFVPSPGMAGRPRSAKTDQIFLTWMDLGRPSLYSRKLAHAVYRAEFTKANSRERKKMIDQCRRAVERRRAQTRLNPLSE